ncbi:MAG: hypothetical protein KDA60_14495 [Planctomycetales bacterium]|nr:hypothetical protein [Planctomycetales bacterium]
MSVPTTGPPAPAANQLYVIIHGVGDPAPGETLQHFLRGQSVVSPVDVSSPAGSATIVRTQTDSVEWLLVDRDQNRTVETFPVHVRRVLRQTPDGRHDQQVFAEVYWGDISQVRGGRFGVLRGILDVLFGLRHIAYQGADQPGWCGRLLRIMSGWTADVIRGPLAAVNFMLLLLWITAIVLVRFFPVVYRRGAVCNIVVMAVAALIFFVACYLNDRKSPREHTFLRWLAFWAFDLFLIGAAVASSFSRGPSLIGNHNAIIWHSSVVMGVLGAIWLWLTALVIAMSLVWFIGRLSRRYYGPGLDAAFLVSTLTVGLWGQCLPTAWRVAFLFGKRTGIVPRNLAHELQSLFDRALPLMGLQWTMAALLIAIAFFVALYHTIWKRTHSASGYRKTRPAPRLLVNPVVAATAASSALVGTSALLYLVWLRYSHPAWETTWFGRFLSHGNAIAASVASLAGVVASYTLAYLRVGIDILFDVVTHFHRSHYLHRHTASFRFRDEIGDRAEAVIKHFAESDSTLSHLTVITHSQGSMIGIEVLNNPVDVVPWQRFDEIRLVTMGSPFLHLYQHYFGHKYPPLDHADWKPLRQRVRSWLNIFRIDDFVGTYIIDDPGFQARYGDMTVTDQPVDPLGHTGYWTDRQVIAALREHGILGRPGSQVPLARRDRAA